MDHPIGKTVKGLGLVLLNKIVACCSLIMKEISRTWDHIKVYVKKWSKDYQWKAMIHLIIHPVTWMIIGILAYTTLQSMKFSLICFAIEGSVFYLKTSYRPTKEILVN